MWKKLTNGTFAEFCFIKLDIAGHSKIVENNPKKRVSNTLDSFENYVDGYISDFGGQLWSWQGDGGLVAFLGRESTENAVKSALCIIDELDSFNKFKSEISEEIRVRIAIHIGTALYREHTGRIHSYDINFVSHMEEKYASPNDICISHDVYTELPNLAKKKFKETGSFRGKCVYSLQGKIRDKVVVYADHTGLSKREERINRCLHSELKIFSTTADNYFVNMDVRPVLLDKLKSGCKIRVLLLDPDSPFFEDREVQEKTHFRERQKASIENIKELKKIFPEQIELRFFNCAPTYQALIIDDIEIVAAISIYSFTGTIEFPCLEITNGPDTNELFRKFTDAFEELWNKSKKVV